MTKLVLILAFILIPWRAEYLFDVLSVPIVWSGDRCLGRTACCYDGILYLAKDWRNNPADPSLAWVVVHELQHYYQVKERIWLTEGGWPEFKDLVQESVLSREDLTRYQRFKIDFLWDRPSELHAHLPYILMGDLPSDLQSWYPWLNL